MKRQNLILGGILLLTLVLAYRIWTEEASPVLASGDFTIWQGDASEIDSISYSYRSGHLRIEQRSDPEWGTYFWGVATAQEADTANFIPSPGFLVGVEGQNIFASFATLKAVREFETVTEEQKVEYGLTSDSIASLVVYFQDGARELTVGGTSHGDVDRYALDPSSGRGMVLANEVFTLLEGGARFLQERRLHAYSPEDVRSARLISPDYGELALLRTPKEIGGSSWSLEEDPGSTNPGLTSFMESYNSLWFSDIMQVGDRDLMASIVRVEYFGGDGRPLGYLELLRWDGLVDTPIYYMETELTRSPVEIPFFDTPQKIERELPTLF